MSSVRAASRPSQPGVTRRLRRATSRRAAQVRRVPSQTDRTLRVLLAASTVGGVAGLLWTDVVPLTVFVLPLVIGSLTLGPRQLPWFVVYTLGWLAVVVANQPEINARLVVTVAILFLAGLVVLLTSFRRSRLGVGGAMGESMFIDLRDRILNQGRLPELPDAWHAESALRSAGGTPFAGDFVVASRAEDGDRLEVAVVDVSGKGEQAGTRALLLSGAFGGLLGALPAESFLPAANDYLLRQGWDEGFATAVHLSLDLTTGAYEIRTAGHPPAAQLHAGSGRWIVQDSEGPVLGLVEEAEFRTARGSLGPGDALLLYTDGMVETRSRDIGLGIDKLLGQAERLLRSGFKGGADRLVDALGSQDDDRALVLLHRP
ncbi:PP2C family protein-serine/threonine phosphatase [Nocardioides pacificus]